MVVHVTDDLNEFVLVSKKRLADLEDNSRMLSALEAGGVDNWEWYSESLQDYYDKKEESK